MPLLPNVEYTHTNLITTNWKRLAAFYERVFGCTPLPPARDLSGEWLDRGTGIDQASLRGAHLRLPGHGDRGPTLEIFEYTDTVSRDPLRPNHTGFGHIAFRVDDVAAAVEVVLSEGGARVGEVVTSAIPGAGILTFAYVRDPDGNIIELQRWTR